MYIALQSFKFGAQKVQFYNGAKITIVKMAPKLQFEILRQNYILKIAPKLHF